MRNKRLRNKKNKTPYILGSRHERLLMDEKNRRKSVPLPLPNQKFDVNNPRRSILVWINTYNRPQDLRNLLSDIHRNKNVHKIKVLVFDDCSTHNYDKVFEKFEGKLNLECHTMATNHGKKGYWKLCTYAMQVIRDNSNFNYFVKLDDDGRLVDRFFDKCCHIWESIHDPRKICLNFRVDSREGKRVWTNFVPQKKYFNGIPVYRSQWVDMDFFVPFQFFSTLGYEIPKPPDQRWRNPLISSGTGKYISNRLHKMGYSLYLTEQTLVIHDEHDSKMNPRERSKNPLITKPITNPTYGDRIDG